MGQKSDLRLRARLAKLDAYAIRQRSKTVKADVQACRASLSRGERPNLRGTTQKFPLCGTYLKNWDAPVPDLYRASDTGSEPVGDDVPDLYQAEEALENGSYTVEEMEAAAMHPLSAADDHFAERVLDQMNVCDLSDTMVAAATGYSHDTISSFRRGRRRPRRGDPRTDKLAEVLEVTKAWLLRGVEPKERHVTSHEGHDHEGHPRRGE